MNPNTTHQSPWMVRMAKGLGLALVGLVLAGCERPIPESVQSGYRGTGMAQVYNARRYDMQMKVIGSVDENAQRANSLLSLQG